MNKTELIEKIANKTGLEKSKVSQVVNGFLDVVTEALAKHETVTLIGFGTFKVKKRKARKGVNPQTRKPMTIPAASVPSITFGESLKEAVSNKKATKKFLTVVAKKSTKKAATTTKKAASSKSSNKKTTTKKKK